MPNAELALQRSIGQVDAAMLDLSGMSVASRMTAPASPVVAAELQRPLLRDLSSDPYSAKRSVPFSTVRPPMLTEAVSSAKGCNCAWDDLFPVGCDKGADPGALTGLGSRKRLRRM